MLGSLSSYASTLLLVIYFLFAKSRVSIPIPFLILTLLYFIFSGLNPIYGIGENDLLKEFVRSIVVVLFSAQVLKDSTKKEIYYILLIGASSIIINAVIFPLANANFYPTYGRYSGFYLNPNFAGSICVIGYALSYLIKHSVLRLSGQFILTIAGVFTFSRTFILIWLLINIIAIIRSKKNLVTPIVGAGAFIFFFTISSMLSLNEERFNAIESIFSSDKEVQTETLEEDSRTQTWAIYTDFILEKPFFGNGYYSFQTKAPGLPGVHNAYLMIFGESGIIPFSIMLGIYTFILFQSLKTFKHNPENFYLAFAITIFLLTGHGYFDNYCNIFLSIFAYLNVKKLQKNILA
ncbi:O-antigen ligase family protein [Euzebyella saccharophila]|uniref:O-antigen ligase family protein n=1 Tax=Euzebyella saccharophila TaxID=679664 RepID=A0ABV8JSM5_9FLAO|nr:O-antigen ligase family protein [Euzebyella saccharophila]